MRVTMKLTREEADRLEKWLRIVGRNVASQRGWCFEMADRLVERIRKAKEKKICANETKVQSQS